MERLLRVPGLLHVAIDRAGVHRVDEHREIGVRGEQDADGVGPALLGLLEELDAVHPGHPLVADDDRRIDPLEHLERFGAAERVVERERFSEREAERVEVVFFVVDDEDVELAERDIAHAERRSFPLPRGDSSSLAPPADGVAEANPRRQPTPRRRVPNGPRRNERVPRRGGWC